MIAYPITFVVIDLLLVSVLILLWVKLVGKVTTGEVSADMRYQVHNLIFWFICVPAVVSLIVLSLYAIR